MTCAGGKLVLESESSLFQLVPSPFLIDHKISLDNPLGGANKTAARRLPGERKVAPCILEIYFKSRSGTRTSHTCGLPSQDLRGYSRWKERVGPESTGK